MTRFALFDVLQLAPRCLTLKWQLEDIQPGHTEHLTFYRSESPDGPWEPIGDSITGREAFHDHDANIYHPNVTVYYKIKGYTEDAGGTTITIKDSKVEHLRFKPDRVALNIIRQQRLLLRKLNGTPGFFLIRKTWGAKCTACYNEKLDKVMTSDCGICYNTKYVGGYYEPVPGYCASSNKGKDQKGGEDMDFSTSRLALWTTNSPELKKGDVWVDAIGKRWIVDKIDTQTTKLRTVMRQLFVADEIPADDRIYEIPVPLVYSLEKLRERHYWDTASPYGG